jgi:arylsulfatase A-like enzyme
MKESRLLPEAKRNRRQQVLLALLGVALTSTACVRTPPPGNVLILVLDACRPDKLGAYGFERPTSPVIDALAADPDGVVFQRHYVQAPATKGSTASLFTGRLVRQHGVVFGLNDREDPGARVLERSEIVDERFETLAEKFREAGYFTFAVPGSWHLLAEYGYGQGFDEYHSPRNLPGGDGRRVAKTLELIEGSEAPFFGYVHLNACHFPFIPERRDAAYMAEFGFDYDEKSRQAAGVDVTRAELKGSILRGEVELTPDDVRFLNLVYEAQLRSIDERQVGRIVRALREGGRYDETLILLSADHGEELYDHAGYGHGHALWEEVIHVPLIAKFPKGRKPGALRGPVSEITRAIDLLPSLTAWIGGSVSPELSGVSILEGVFPDNAISEQKHFSRALVRDRYKLIEQGRRAQLFDLRADPGETHDLAAAMPERLASMQRFLSSELERLGPLPQDAEDIDRTPHPGEVEELRALGYIE